MESDFFWLYQGILWTGEIVFTSLFTFIEPQNDEEKNLPDLVVRYIPI